MDINAVRLRTEYIQSIMVWIGKFPMSMKHAISGKSADLGKQAE